MIMFYLIVRVLAALILTPGATLADWGTYDGHAHCLAVVADTSIVFCADGFTEST